MLHKLLHYFHRPALSDSTIDEIVDRVLERLVMQSKPLTERDRSPQLYKVMDFLDAHEDKTELTLRELELLTGVSKSYVSRAKKQWEWMRSKEP